MEVVRTYRFARDSYVVEVRVDVANRGEESWQGALYGQLQRVEPESEGGLFRTYTYTGGILSGPEKPYEKVDFSDMASQDVDRDVDRRVGRDDPALLRRGVGPGSGADQPLLHQEPGERNASRSGW